MIKLYYHGGSSNHGCEAIVRSTQKIIMDEMCLYTRDIASDKKYNIDNLMNLVEDYPLKISQHSAKGLLSAIHYKLTKTDFLFTKYTRSPFFSEVRKGDVYLSVGGDNYCYSGKDVLGFYNRIIHEKGGKTVLWGCSIEPEDLNEALRRDLALYDLIVSRESISYEALKHVNKNTYLIPDPAFLLDKIEVKLPENFVKGKIVGINVSPLIISRASNNAITVQNYRELIRYIINNTDMQIVLVPHVVGENNDDRVPLKQLYDEFSDTQRVVLLEDYNAMQLKGFISNCKFFVGARTHATIAAYSTCVPTLVVGYSVKARGIARDIFGTEDNYVLPVQSLKNETDLVKSFEWLMQHENEIKSHLCSFIPSYCNRVWKAKDLVRELQCLRK